MITENNSVVAETQIRGIIEERIKAIHDRDIEGIVSKYIPDVISFDLKEPLQNNGTDGIRKRLEEWFKGYKSPINQELRNLEIAANDDIAFSHCLTRTYGSAENGEKMDMWYRTTTGYRKIDGKWFITHDHNSEPFDMTNLKAFLNLKP